jgi:hypothetical protein
MWVELALGIFAFCIMHCYLKYIESVLIKLNLLHSFWSTEIVKLQIAPSGLSVKK